MNSDFEMVVGLEVHSQLLTKTKLFVVAKTALEHPRTPWSVRSVSGIPESFLS